MGIPISRRMLLAAAPAALLVPAAVRAGPTVPSDIMARAKAAAWRHRGRLKDTQRIAIADFGTPSRDPRFHLVDLRNGRVRSLLVAHGKGSDPSHVGWLQRFSNEPGSEATSQGAFVSAEIYAGQHGLSRRLDGLETTNSNARERAIVVHAAPYVSTDMAARMGKIGRSQGCFAFEDAVLGDVVDWLGDGRLIWAERAA